MAASVIEVQGVSKRYGEVLAVDGVDLLLEAGGIFGLIGRNGAGKSTLFRMMLGLTPPDAGDIRIGGEPVRGRRFREVRRSIGYLPENAVFYDNLTGLETLRFFAALKGARATACQPLLDKVGLGAAGGKRVRGYSKGMRQRLALAQALLGEPQLLFLDEPTNGLDPEGVREFYAILGEVRGRGGTVLLTSHILAEIQERVDSLAIMKLGRLQARGTLQELRESMNLPLVITLRPREGNEAGLRAALAALGLQAVPGHDAALSVTCRRELKMAVLEAVAALPGAVTDLQVREPSLEDVYLGHAA